MLRQCNHERGLGLIQGTNQGTQQLGRANRAPSNETDQRNRAASLPGQTRCEQRVGEGDLLNTATHQLRTMGLTRPSTSLSAMLCSIRLSIASWSVT